MPPSAKRGTGGSRRRHSFQDPWRKYWVGVWGGGDSRRRIHFRGGAQGRLLWISRRQRGTRAFRSMIHSGETTLQDTFGYEAGEALRAAAFGSPGGGEHPQRPAHPNHSAGLTFMHLPFVKQGSNAEKALP